MPAQLNNLIALSIAAPIVLSIVITVIVLVVVRKYMRTMDGVDQPTQPADTPSVGEAAISETYPGS